MSSGTFEGNSTDGKLEDALATAIANAKQALRTELVNWKLLEVSGENGGFVATNNLSVRIRARTPAAPSAKKKAAAKRKR